MGEVHGLYAAICDGDDMRRDNHYETKETHSDDEEILIKNEKAYLVKRFRTCTYNDIDEAKEEKTFDYINYLLRDKKYDYIRKRYRRIFSDYEIDGKTLLRMNEFGLVQIGIKSDDAKVIERAIEKLNAEYQTLNALGIIK